MAEGFEDVNSLNARMMNVNDEGIMNAASPTEKRSAAAEFKKSLKLAKLRNRITKNSITYAGKLEKEDKILLEGLKKLNASLQDTLKQGAIKDLKRIFALDAKMGLEVPKPKGGASKGGGGIGGALAIGVGAAATFLLIAAIGKMVQQSKIVSVVEKSINQALGLLLDLVLIPFIPAISYGLIQLYYGVTDLAAGINAIQKDGLLRVIFGFDVSGFLGNFFEPLLTWMFDPASPTKLLNFGLWLTGLFLSPLVGLSEFLIDGLLRILLGEGAPTVKSIEFSILGTLGEGLQLILDNPFISALIEFAFGLDKAPLTDIVIRAIIKIIPDWSAMDDRGNSGAGGFGGFGGNGVKVEGPDVGGLVMNTLANAMFQGIA